MVNLVVNLIPCQGSFRGCRLNWFMTVERESGGPRRFVATRLPWLIGAAGLLLYLITLNGWVSLYSAGTVARVSGWEWRPELQQPLTYLLLYPLHGLPETWIPLALNLLAAA